MRILVVDGEFQSRWVISGWLSAFLNGVAVESAASADEALAAIEQRRPDLVLAAHPLPEVDGIELARRVKAKHNPPTVVVMTEQSNADFEAACAAAGADYCLEKRHLQARLLLFLQERFSLTVARQAVV
jgi:two-component system response regulator VicR